MSYLLMIPKISFSIPNTLRSLDTIHIRSFFLSRIYIFVPVSLNVLSRRMKKGKQHKTIKSSRKKRFENIFCLGCEWDFFFGWERRQSKNEREWEPQHMVYLFNVTIKQVILLASSSSQYSHSLFVDPFFHKRNNLLRFCPQIKINLSVADGIMDWF